MGHRTARTLALLATLGLLAAACGTDSRDQATDDASSTTTEARSDELHLELLGCHQAGFPTGIDPADAQARLEEGQELYLDEEGQARFTLIAKDCEDIVVDGRSTGGGHFTTAWIRITGPDEIRSFAGLPPEAVGPTDYFHPVTFQTDNADFADEVIAFGVPMTLATSITMDPAAPGPMTGSVDDADPERPLSYRWTMDNTNAIPEGPSGVTHVLSGTDDRGSTLTYDIECPIDGGWFTNPTTIEFDPGSAVEDLVGTGYSGVGPSPNLSCDITITRGPS